MNPPDQTVRLERRDPARNMARAYQVSLAIDLFGTVLLVRQWGRIGTRGQALHAGFDTAEAARAARDRLLAAKRRRGYCDRT